MAFQKLPLTAWLNLYQKQPFGALSHTIGRAQTESVQKVIWWLLVSSSSPSSFSGLLKPLPYVTHTALAQPCVILRCLSPPGFLKACNKDFRSKKNFHALDGVTMMENSDFKKNIRVWNYKRGKAGAFWPVNTNMNKLSQTWAPNWNTFHEMVIGYSKKTTLVAFCGWAQSHIWALSVWGRGLDTRYGVMVHLPAQMLT